MQPDPDYRITTYRSENADPGKEWVARVQHPRVGPGNMAIFFEGSTEADVIARATEFWEQERKKREEEWARRDASRREAEARRKAKAEVA